MLKNGFSAFPQTKHFRPIVEISNEFEKVKFTFENDSSRRAMEMAQSYVHRGLLCGNNFLQN